MDVKLSIDDQEIWEKRRQKLAALMRADLSQQQNDPAQPNKIVDPQLFSLAKEGDVDKFIEALEDHCAKERVSLPVLLGLRSPSKNTLLHAAAESDDNIKAVIDFVPELITCKNSRGETPLHIAARNGKTGAVELLLLQDLPRDTDCCGNSALHEAVRNGHHNVIGQLVSKDPNLLHCQNNESKSPLCVAVETGNLEVLALLLDAPDDGEDQRRSESERVFSMSPAHVAILHRKMDTLIKLWEKKSWLLQLRDAEDGTLLHLAEYNNYLDGVKFLIEKFPTSTLEQNRKGCLPIHVACMMDRVMIVKELLQQWQDPAEFLTKLGQNILHVSARHGSTATVEYILKSPNFDHLINARDFEGNTPLHLAALHYQPSVVLLARDGRVDKKLVNNHHMTALDVVERDIQERFPPFGQRWTRITLKIAKTPTSLELSTGSRPQKLLERRMDWEGHRDLADSRVVVLALVASVTFTSGFSVPGGYNGSEGDAGIPILLHKAMFNVFVISNSVAMYSSSTALGILFWSYIHDPYVGPGALLLSNTPLWVTVAAAPLAFMAGVYVTVSKLHWLSIFTLVLGSVFLSILLSVYTVIHIPVAYKSPFIRCFTYKLLLWGLRKTGGDTAVTSVRGTRDDKP